MKNSLFSYFGKYFSVGIINTALHWLIFFLLIWLIELSSAWANLIAFTVAASFSFFANAIYTFKVQATRKRYFYFMIFMALLSFQTGWATDWFNLPKIVALVSFSGLSLVLGFLYSRYLVFNDNPLKQ